MRYEASYVGVSGLKTGEELDVWERWTTTGGQQFSVEKREGEEDRLKRKCKGTGRVAMTFILAKGEGLKPRYEEKESTSVLTKSD